VGAVIYLARWQASRDEVRVTVLPLNGAHTVFVDAAGRRNDWLIDCGNTNAVAFVTKPFLRAQGVNRVSRLALTHGDLRYAGGFQPMEELFGVKEVYTSPVRFRSAAYRRIVSELEAEPERHQFIRRGDAAGAWRVLHPAPEDKFPQADDNALVLLGDFHGTRLLLLSDLGRPGQEALMQRESDLRADIVVSGLPEQSEPLSDALLERVQPKVVIVADSEVPATKRVGARLRERLERRGGNVVYTRFSGAVTITLSDAGWELSAMDGRQLSAKTLKLAVPTSEPLGSTNLQTEKAQ
jgi:competence protein ComEC